MGKQDVPQLIVDLYTDVLAHKYEPNGQRVACGTTTGKFFVLERYEDKNEVNRRLTSSIPSGSAVLGLDWGTPGILVGVKNGFYLYPVKENTGIVGVHPTFTDCMSDVMDIRWLSNTNRIAAGCDDGKIRIFDVLTSKLVSTIDNQRDSWDRVSSAIEVLAVSDDYLASGRQDGEIFVFDKELRSQEPIWHLSVGSKLAPGLALTKDSTWLAAGTQGTPTVYNFRTQVALPSIEVDPTLNVKSPQPIYVVTFDDEGSLWWGGGGTTIFGSDCLSRVSASFHTSYGDEVIHHIFSIATGRWTGTGSPMSVAGSSNGVLFTDNGKYWDTYVNL